VHLIYVGDIQDVTNDIKGKAAFEFHKLCKMFNRLPAISTSDVTNGEQSVS
jgi:hypothetical protein